MQVEMSEELINKLKMLASKESIFDIDEDSDEEYEADDCGNSDDILNNGISTGKIMLAREILSALNIKWH